MWTLATLGVLASTALVGGGVWVAAKALGIDLPLSAWFAVVPPILIVVAFQRYLVRGLLAGALRE